MNFVEITDSNGNIINGEFLNFNVDGGKGTIIYLNGDTYCGHIKNNKKHGYGTLENENGVLYKGNFQEDCMCGEGVLMCENETYIGEFNNNLFNGKGILKHVSGDEYSGNYKDNQRHGDGELKSVNGYILKGCWKNGSLVGVNSFNTCNNSSVKLVDFWQLVTNNVNYQQKSNDETSNIDTKENTNIQSLKRARKE